MTFEILQYPKHEVLLRRVARPVREDEFGSDELAEFCTRLGETMMLANGAGLAANQVAETGNGGTEPWALFVLAASDNEWSVLCNPQILASENPRVRAEGCLSFASVGIKMMAPDFVNVAFRNREGKLGQMVLIEERAHAVFHETEHLAGKLMIDRMVEWQRAAFLRDVRKVRGEFRTQKSQKKARRR